jgi:hypothetical protein
VRDSAQVVKECTRRAVELVVEALDDRPLEHSIANALALGTAQLQPPAPVAHFGPRQRIDEPPAAVEADVQPLRLSDGPGRRWPRGAAPAKVLYAGLSRPLCRVVIPIGLHSLLSHLIDPRGGGL